MRPYQNYQRINISTADPVRMIVLLYEGALKNLNQAIPLMGVDNMSASVKITRTLDIINYLRNVLDFEKGGEIAVNLARLYDYMRNTLALANINQEQEQVKTVIGLLQTLLEGWRGVVGTQAGASAEQPPVNRDRNARPPV